MRSPTAEWYDRAATRDLVGHSSVHVAWATRVADDPEILALIDRLPRERRQPSLLFSVARWLGAPENEYPALRSWLLKHWPKVEAAARVRRPQTNEVGRCAPLLAALERIPGPLALLEVGASAGLCLTPDRYSFRYDEGPVIGAGAPLIGCCTSGSGRSPRRLPQIVWRRGIDLDPLSVADPEDVRWLESLLPPDRPDRLDRLRQAVGTVGDDPPEVVAGDAVEALPALAAAAPSSATLVVVSLGTLVYLPPDARTGFPGLVEQLGARLVTLEGVAVVPGIADQIATRSAPEPRPFVLALDGEPLAFTSPHGDRMSWLSPASRDGLTASPI
jgi:hypothetical protein